MAAPAPGFVSRAAIGFWFGGLAILAYARFFMRLQREGGAGPDLSAWLWLGGAVVLSVAGVAIVLREAVRARRRGAGVPLPRRQG